MKKLLILLLIFTAFNLSAIKHLTKVYHKDYGVITRLVIVFDSKVETEITSVSAQQRLEIYVSNTTRSHIVEAKTMFLSNNLTAMKIEDLGNEIAIIVSTEKPFSASHFTLGANPYKLVIDIFTVGKPRSIEHLTDFASFYQTVGLYNKAEKVYKTMVQLHPKESLFYYNWALMDLKRGNKNSAILKLKKVKNNTNVFHKAYKKLNELVPPTQIPQITKSSKKVVAKVKEKLDNKPKLKILKTDSTKTQQPVNYKDEFLEFYNNSSSKAQKFKLLGLVAHSYGKYEDAISYFLKISDKDEVVNRELYELYTTIEDTKNAKYYKSLLSPKTSEVKITPRNILHMHIKLLYALIFAGLIAILVFFLLMLYYNKRRMKEIDDSFSNEEVSYHSDILKKSYENKENQDNNNDEPIEFQLNSSDNSESEIDKTKNEQSVSSKSIDEEDLDKPIEDVEEEQIETIVEENSDETDSDENLEYENAPIISDDISDDEEKELIEDEEKSKLFDELSDDDEDSDDSGLGNDAYQKKMILKLANDDWDAAAIAKELRISQNEVEFFLKTNS
ncbi:MAG: hypothetical protein U9N34_06050 [Candidatus Cloacimonadota bacterium]|nr:hypothetical protein [Candidatus Cloacimonadota bacterium]